MLYIYSSEAIKPTKFKGLETMRNYNGLLHTAKKSSHKAKTIAVTLEIYLALRPKEDQGIWLELEREIDRVADLLINEIRA